MQQSTCVRASLARAVLMMRMQLEIVQGRNAAELQNARGRAGPMMQ